MLVIPKMITEVNKTAEQAELALILQRVKEKQIKTAKENLEKIKSGKIMS